MAYKPRRFDNVRDETYPNQIAEERPALAARIHCQEDFSVLMDAADASLRGKLKRAPEPPHETFAGKCEWFNEALRAGHGFRNQGDE
jgi:hypothetical protein